MFLSSPLPVPCLVHQIYDYQSPNFFLYMSLLSVQRYMRPKRHILWVNEEGRYRKSHWESWQTNAAKNHPNSWEANLSSMFKTGQIEVRLITFPLSPPGNESIFVSNKAHRSDFVRMDVLLKMGGMYLDTDAFPMDPLTELRRFNFSLAFDNIVNADERAPKRLNNGVLLSAPQAPFLRVWAGKYADFDPSSWDYHSSVLPFKLAAAYPDLLHVEMSRISPISYGFHTSVAAASLTCGILVQTRPMPPPPVNGTGTGTGSSTGMAGDSCSSAVGWKDIVGKSTFNAIWHPRWSTQKRAWTFEGTVPDEYMFNAISDKLVLHLTMSAVRGLCMLRKNLRGPDDLALMPSLLGSIFRVALRGHDSFDYLSLLEGKRTQDTAASSGIFRDLSDRKLQAWNGCRAHLGVLSTPEDRGPYLSPDARQQYTTT